MKIPWFRKNKTVPPVEKKGFSGPPTSFTEFLFNGGNSDLGNISAINLYMSCMPLFNAISLRAETYARIPLRVQNRITEEFIDDHPVLDLLRTPNADVSQSEFLEQFSSFYDITGDSYLLATGRPDAPPLELATVAPQRVTFGGANEFSMFNVPSSMWVHSAVGASHLFKAFESSATAGIRFINARENLELWHTRTFNPLQSSTNFRGMSKAQPIWLECEQYVSGNVNNISLLKRGTRLSMAWVNNRGEELTETQWERMQEEAQKYSGSENAGGTPVLDGMDVKPISQTNRDMEFVKLQSTTFERISNNYRIPLALLLSETMTLDNLKTAILQLYDNSVLPLGDRLNNELTRFLMPRYPDSENLIITYNERDISALKMRAIQTAKELMSIGVNTDNEIRNILGFEDVDGGDILYKNPNLVPISDLSDPVDDEDAIDEVEDEKQETWEEKRERIKLIWKNAGFSEEKINDMVKRLK